MVNTKARENNIKSIKFYKVLSHLCTENVPRVWGKKGKMKVLKYQQRVSRTVTFLLGACWKTRSVTWVTWSGAAVTWLCSAVGCLEGFRFSSETSEISSAIDTLCSLSGESISGPVRRKWVWSKQVTWPKWVWSDKSHENCEERINKLNKSDN